MIDIRLSKYLNRDHIQKDLDFLDVDTNVDVMLFVDPLLLPDNFKKVVDDFLSGLMKFIVKGIKKIHLTFFHIRKNVMRRT